MAVARPWVMYWKVFCTPRSTSRLGNLRPEPGPEEQSGPSQGSALWAELDQVMLCFLADTSMLVLCAAVAEQEH